MRRGTRSRTGRPWRALALAGAVAVMASSSLEAQDGQPRGKALYDRWCAGCHGAEGRGDGPSASWMLPRPRDFTTALYQIRSTGSGELPTDADILRIINVGMPGTTMPGWEGILSRQDRQALVEYVKSFSAFFETSPPPDAIDFGRAPRASEQRLEEGREVYQEVECWRCHGDEGRGDGASAPTLEDDQGLPIRAADLTKNWRFNGGGTVEDVYRRLRTGLDGTPMPSSNDLIEAGVLTDDQLWSLAHYVRSLAPEREPRTREVIAAAFVEDGELPSAPDDGAWDDVERFYVPLAGQIIVEPRWFDPRVAGLWVQALHDGRELALRVSWSDPSRSPDASWDEWKRAVYGAMEPKEAGPLPDDPLPDQLIVQFPARMPRGMERPYFLLGDARNPAYLWHWRSDRPGAEEAEGRGMHGVSPLSGQGGLAATAVHDAGQWSVVLRRALEAPGEGSGLDLPTAQAVPVAFLAWDGDNAEWDGRAAVSSWYFIYLQEATPATVFVAPALAMLLTAALGLLAVANAQKRERQRPGDDDGVATPAVPERGAEDP